MRNFKDLSRALASIATGLKGIKDIIDTIEPGGGGVGGVNYSTTEQDTGLKWTDGTTPVYQKTFTGTCDGAGGFSVAHGITNLDTIVSLDCCLGPVAVGTSMAIPSKIAEVYVEAVNIVALNSNTAYASQPYNITIRYTKTSE